MHWSTNGDKSSVHLDDVRSVFPPIVSSNWDYRANREWRQFSLLLMSMFHHFLLKIPLKHRPKHIEHWMEFWSLFSKKKKETNLKRIKISSNKNLLIWNKKLSWKIFLEIFFDTFHNFIGMSHMEMMRTFDRWHFKLKEKDK